MSESTLFTSYMLAAVAGICFVKGIAILTGGRRN